MARNYDKLPMSPLTDVFLADIRNWP